MDASNNTAVVLWNIPRGTDNSNDTVAIKEVHGYLPGQRFKAGTYTVEYTIQDKTTILELTAILLSQ